MVNGTIFLTGEPVMIHAFLKELELATILLLLLEAMVALGLILKWAFVPIVQVSFLWIFF